MTEVNNVASTVLTTLDVGSGIDIVKLSEDLTNAEKEPKQEKIQGDICLLYTSPSPRDLWISRMPSSA